MMSDTMHRTQLLLDDWQYDALKAQARGSRRSLSDLVRQIVTAHLGNGARRTSARMLEIEGVAEGPADLAGAHDGYLYGSAPAPRPADVTPVAAAARRRRGRSPRAS